MWGKWCEKSRCHKLSEFQHTHTHTRMFQNEVDRSVAPTEPRLAAAWAVRALQCSLVHATAPRQPAGTPPLHGPGGPRIPALWLWMRCLGHRGNAVGSAFPEQLLTPTPLSTLYLVRLLAQQAMQAPRFLHLPRNLRSFLSHFFQPQTTRPSATGAFGFVHRLPCPPSTASRRGRRTRRVLAFLGLNIINQEFRARRESTVLLVW